MHSQPPTRRVACALRQAFPRLPAGAGTVVASYGPRREHALRLCSLHTTLQKDFWSRRLAGEDPLVWSPQPGFPQSRDPAVSFTISHRGQVAKRSLSRWAKSLKPLCIVYVPSLTPELWHPRFVVRTRKGAPESGPLTWAHGLLLAYSPLSSLSCFFSSSPSAVSSLQVTRIKSLST